MSRIRVREMGGLDVLSDERRMMGRWSGALWLLGAAVAAACQPLPGLSDDHQTLVWALIVGLALYGVACFFEWIPWSRAPIWAHLAAVIAFQPVLGLALWASGGVNSYIFPVLVLAMLYSAYFLPGWMAWVGVGALAATFASTLIYTPIDEDQALARVLAFAIACEGVTLTLQTLKRRLIDAEAAQLAPTHKDPLTGLATHAAFDAALAAAVAAAGAPELGRRVQDPEHFSLLLINVEQFTKVVQRHGATAADAALQELSRRVGALVRPQDCVARLGRDEIGIVAIGAGEDGARRLAQAIRVAAAQVHPGGEGAPLSAMVSWTVFPADGADPADLYVAVDRALDSSRHPGEQA